MKKNKLLACTLIFLMNFSNYTQWYPLTMQKIHAKRNSTKNFLACDYENKGNVIANKSHTMKTKSNENLNSSLQPNTTTCAAVTIQPQTTSGVAVTSKPQVSTGTGIIPETTEVPPGNSGCQEVTPRPTGNGDVPGCIKPVVTATPAVTLIPVTTVVPNVTMKPIVTPSPTVVPTKEPVPTPTLTPTLAPTGAPYVSPTPVVTEIPATSATQMPKPTRLPGMEIVRPTMKPTDKPPATQAPIAKVNYVLNQGKNDSRNPSVVQSLPVSLYNAKKSGYVFEGWYTEKNFKNKVTSICYSGNEMITLYAKWSKVTVKKVVISSAKRVNDSKIRVKVKKIDAVDGYEYVISTTSTFSKKTRVISKKNPKDLVRLQKGKVYYIKVRAYKLDSYGKKKYGSYSKVKKCSK